MIITLNLKCRFIINENGEHSFQIVEETTNKIVYSCEHWYKTRAEAEDYAQYMRKRFVNEAKMNKAIESVTGNSEFASVDFKDNQQTLKLECALAVHRKTGKFGYAVIAANDEVIIKPKAWYDTVEQAWYAAKSESDKIMAEIERIVPARGYAAASYTEPPFNDFKGDTKTSDEPKVPQSEPIKPSKELLKDLFSIDQLCSMFDLGPQPVHPDKSNTAVYKSPPTAN